MKNPVALKCLSVMLALVMAFLFVPPYVFGKGLPETEVETAIPISASSVEFTSSTGIRPEPENAPFRL